MMFLQTEALNEFEQTGDKLSDIFTKVKSAFDAAIDPQTTLNTLTGMDNEAKKLARTIGSGVVGSSDAFRERLFTIQQSVVDINVSFDDVIKAVEGLNDETGKLTIPSKAASEQMLEISKSTGIGSTEVGKMTGQFMKLTMGQKTATSEMARISKLARQTGVDASKLLATVADNLKKVDAYNFKKGEEGLSRMVAQAQRLGATVDDIGAFKFAEDLIDPEKAIEAAANFSMLGGSIEGLTNPFQLMNDGANNVDNLQNKLIDLAKSAFKVDETTGKIETNFLAQQRLREQVKVFGGDYEKYLQLGRAAQKEQLVQNKLLSAGFDTAKLGEDQLNLVKSLAEIGPGGKMELRIPGFETEDLAATLKNNPAALSSALEEYQKTAAMSDRQLAEQGLNLQELQQVDTRIIRDYLLRNLGEAQRSSIIAAAIEGQSKLAETAKTTSKPLMAPAELALKTLPTAAFGEAQTRFISEAPTPYEVELLKSQGMETSLESIKPKKPTSDAAFGTGTDKVLSLGKGEIFNFIKEDEAIFAPDAIKNVGILKDVYMNYMDMSKNIPNEMKLIEPTSSKTPTVTKQDINTSTNINTTNKETVDININVTLDGKSLPNGPLSDLLFKNPSTIKELENKVMDVIEKQEFLKRGKGRFNR